jgi:hypothetical protein
MPLTLFFELDDERQKGVSVVRLCESVRMKKTSVSADSTNHCD